MKNLPNSVEQPECPQPHPQLENVYEFDLQQPEDITPVPFSELALYIPGLAAPYIGYDGAINKATKNIDPEKGLLCILNPYLDMAANDFIEIFFGSADIPATFTTVSDIQADGGHSIPVYISEAWLQYGEVFPCFFRVTPPGGNSVETKRFKFFIDDYEPAGPDPDHATPYNEHLDAPKFEQHIVDDGVTPEDAIMGVKVFISKYPNRPGLSPRYNWAARDTIWLLLNGHEVKHSVTEGEASGSDPIVITVYNTKWNDIGSGDVVAQYFVIDEAKNKTVSPSPVTIIQSLIGNPHPLLDAPFIAELNDEGQIDINWLGGDPATLVINVPGRGVLKIR